MDKTLGIDIHRQEEMVFLLLHGRLDTLGSRQLDEVLTAEFTPTCRQVFLDIKEVAFLSSAGIRILIKYYKLCHEASGELVLQNVPQQAVDVLKMVGLEKLILEKENHSKNPEKQSVVYEDIQLEWWKLHDETAEMIHKKTDDKPFLSPDVYKTLIGRAVTEPNGRLSEFISVGSHLFCESEGNQYKGARSLYYSGSSGSPSHLFRFYCPMSTTADLEKIMTLLLDLSECSYAGVAGIVRTAGLSGCQPPTTDTPIRFSPRLLYPNSSLLLAGITHRNEPNVFYPFSRLLSRNSTLSGHFHAAVLPDFTFNRKETDLNKVLQSVPDLAGGHNVFHLINDERPVEGNGQTLFYEGHLWLSRIKSEIDD